MAVKDAHLWCVLESNHPRSQTEAFLAHSQTENQKVPLHIIINKYCDSNLKLEASHNGGKEASDVSDYEFESINKLANFLSVVACHFDR
jgi:hypothetical protein